MYHVAVLFRDKYRIPSARLPHWDYRQSSCYFVTICVKDHARIFGRVADGRVSLSRAGEIAAEEWRRAAAVRKNVVVDQLQIMPNHLHGIIVIRGDVPVGRFAPDVETLRCSVSRIQEHAFQPNAGGE